MRTTKSLLLLLLGLFAVAAAPAGRDVSSAAGEVRAEGRVVEAQPGRLVLDREAGLWRLALPEGVPVFYAGRPLTDGALAPGDQVRVTYLPGPAGATARSIELLPRTGPAPKAVPLEAP